MISWQICDKQETAGANEAAAAHQIDRAESELPAERGVFLAALPAAKLL